MTQLKPRVTEDIHLPRQEKKEAKKTIKAINSPTLASKL